jgi:competence protein ComEC
MLKTLRQAPFLRLVFSFIAGIIIQYNYDVSSGLRYILILAFALFVPTFFPKINKQYSLRCLFGMRILLLSFASAAFLTQMAWQKSEWKTENRHTYLVRIIDDPVNKPKTIRCNVEIISADSAIKKDVIHKKVIIYLTKDSAGLSLVAGNCLYVNTFLKKPQPLPGEDSFDYPLYLRKQSFSAVAFVRANDWHLETIPIPAGWQWVQFQALAIRKNLFFHLKNILPDNQSFSVAAALMFGYTNELDKEMRQRFSNIGAGHILAVSGLHFNFIFGFASLCLSFLGMSAKAKRIKQLILVPLIWGFAFITGFSPSVIRAACMLTLWGIGDAFFYKSFTLNTVAAVAFFMLLHNPLYLFDVGFQLSFSAVVSIVVINPYLVNLYTSKNKIIKYLWELTAVSFSAQIGVLPLSLYYFHQFPLLFLITNMIMIPLSGILLFLIPFSLLLSSVFGASLWMTFPLRISLSLFISVTEYLDSIPGGTISNINLSVSGTVFMYLGTAFILYLVLRRKFS